MLHVRAMSGEPLADVKFDELRRKLRLENDEDVLVGAVRRFLAAQLKCSRFRLKLVGEDGTALKNEDPLTAPADLTLVKMDFQELDAATKEVFVSACKEGCIEDVEHYLALPGDPDARNSEGWPGAHLAVRESDDYWEFVSLLHEAGADLSVHCPDGLTVLFTAVDRCRADIVFLLLANKMAPVDQICRGMTPLHAAAADSPPQIVQHLLYFRADTAAVDSQGLTVLGGPGGSLGTARKSSQQSPRRREGCRAFGGARQSRNRKKELSAKPQAQGRVQGFWGARRQSRNRKKELSAKPQAQGRVKGFWGGQAAVSEPQERALSKAPGAGKGEGLLGGPGGSLGTARKSFQQSPGRREG